MRTLWGLSALFVTAILVWVWIAKDELNAQAVEQARVTSIRMIDSLKREVRLGPKPYFLVHHDHAVTPKEQDSVMRYLSHFTRSEIFEIRTNITDNVALRGYLDTLLIFKDSLDTAHGIYATIDN